MKRRVKQGRNRRGLAFTASLIVAMLIVCAGLAWGVNWLRTNVFAISDTAQFRNLDGLIASAVIVGIAALMHNGRSEPAQIRSHNHKKQRAVVNYGHKMQQRFKRITRVRRGRR